VFNVTLSELAAIASTAAKGGTAIMITSPSASVL
jgi:hypothetical protein|tara:strand:+ start:334 stop:435 length:102 start_codon:yes stop_codon:yes gene_type:complete